MNLGMDTPNASRVETTVNSRHVVACDKCWPALEMALFLNVDLQSCFKRRASSEKLQALCTDICHEELETISSSVASIYATDCKRAPFCCISH